MLIVGIHELDPERELMMPHEEPFVITALGIYRHREPVDLIPKLKPPEPPKPKPPPLTAIVAPIEGEVRLGRGCDVMPYVAVGIVLRPGRLVARIEGVNIVPVQYRQGQAVRITAVMVNDGQRVRRNDILFTLAPT